MSGSDHEDGDVTGQAEKGNSANADNMENPSNMDIIKAIRTFKQEFHDEMEGVLMAIKNVQKYPAVSLLQMLERSLEQWCLARQPSLLA